MKYIIFDFNGTILDDVDVGVKCINELVLKYLNRPCISKEEYLDIFDFPVIDYYRKAGFDFKDVSFEVIGKEWMDLYNSHKDEYHLMDGVKDILKSNIEKGYKNIILSASKLENLQKQCEELGIEEYFDDILGIDNIYATSKEYIALEWIKDKNPDECIFIGDTLHDMDVANVMGIKSYLVAKGHQSRKKLLDKCERVYDSIEEVIHELG